MVNFEGGLRPPIEHPPRGRGHSPRSERNIYPLAAEPLSE